MTTKTAEVTYTDMSVRGGELTMSVQVLGSGPPLVYFHSAGGLVVDPYVLSLADKYTVYAPYFPGTAPGRPNDIDKLDELWDVVLTYQELLTKLELVRPVAVAQSFGGMLAAEIAATFPGIFSKLVILDAVGLWNDDHPVTNWMATPLEKFPELMFSDPTGPAATATFAMPDDPALVAEIVEGMTQAMECTGKFVWPKPDRGLRRRLHRITTPTLLIWGEDDKLSPAAYADEYAELIPHSTKKIIPDCGHIPQVEQQATVTALVDDFLS
ncbi:alpha/beta hydrolase [Rhodococcus sp. USK13]|uniref:alpha/beta fold hydrolase n=1 Tax=Rhodococcus sp. USK13 TaxID=2806442 RepID=UPI001BCAF6CD|nr:alpha/beta hydrolase [Rhodococcus sp. USK13]